MSLLDNLKTDDAIAEDADFIGGGGLVESGLYNCTVGMAYYEKSAGGALALNLSLKTEQGQEIRQKVWVTSGDAKGNKNFYIDKAGQKKYLPGFSLANGLCLLTCGKEIAAIEPEEKVVGIYNYDEKKEIPTKVPVLTDILGKEVIVGAIRQTVDKNVKDAAGNYVPSGETRDEVEIDKVFHATKRMTVAECRAQAETADFIDKWEAKNKGVTRNRATGAAAASAPQAGGSAAPASAPTKSLFTD